jgi:hypothetical protein
MAVILGGWLVSLASLWLAWRLTGRFNRSLGGPNEGSLEQQLGAYRQQVESLGQRLSQLDIVHQQLKTTTGLASQKISIVRYNPFGDTGGDQSFSLAVLDAHHSGYVLTSIHGRENTRVYVKPIDFGQSKYTLSNEEKQAIEQAVKRVPPSAQAKSDEKEVV